MLKCWKLKNFHKFLSTIIRRTQCDFICLIKKNKIIFFYEKILTQTQVRKLTILDIFKIKRNMQKQCLCGCFACFQSMFDELQIYASHVSDDHI